MRRLREIGSGVMELNGLRNIGRKGGEMGRMRTALAFEMVNGLTLNVLGQSLSSVTPTQNNGVRP